MKLIERVYYSLIGKKIKSLLLLLVITLLGAFLSASFSIYQANNDLEEYVRKSLNPIILIEWRDMYKDEYLFTKEDERQEIIEKYKNDDRVSVMENRYKITRLKRNPIHVVDENNHIYDIFGRTRDKYLFGNKKYIQTTGTNNVIVNLDFVGIDYAKISDIHNNSSTLIKGRVFTEVEIQSNDQKLFVVLRYDTINTFFDDKDSIRLMIPSVFLWYTDKIEHVNYLIENIDYDLGEFEIIGLGEENEENIEMMYHSPNYITSSGHYISSVLMDEICVKIRDIYDQLGEKYPWLKEDTFFDYYGTKYVSETYIELNNADDLKPFVKEVEKECGYLASNVYSFSDSYNDVKSVTRNLNFIAIVSLVISSIASIILLSLIIQVLVNERRYEIGVYLSMGEKRINIIKQILLEVLIVGLLGISLSLFVGNKIASSLSNGLLESQISQLNKVSDSLDIQNSYELDEEEIIGAYQVEINSEYVLSVVVGGVIVLLISCIIPMKSIMKMKVKKMLL